MIENDSKTKAYEWIKTSIESGELEEGQPLPENFLAKEIGVSRTPVREALRLLEQSNHVRIIPTKGAFVSEISIKDVKEIYDIRKLLEPFAALSAVSRIPEAELLNIEDEWLGIAKLVSSVPWTRVAELDFRFHMTIVKYSTNSRIKEMLSSYHSQIKRFQMLSAQSHSDIPDTIKQHMELLIYLKKRDSDQFTNMLLTHITNSEENIIKEFGNQ